MTTLRTLATFALGAVVVATPLACSDTDELPIFAAGVGRSPAAGTPGEGGTAGEGTGAGGAPGGSSGAAGAKGGAGGATTAGTGGSSGATGTGGAGGAAMAVEGDAGVASGAFTANLGEIQLGALAETKGSAAAVRAFATEMENDHTDAQNALLAIVEHDQIPFGASPTSTTLSHGVALQMHHLGLLAGNAFDVAYVSGQVDEHETVLSLIDDSWMPAAHDPALRQYLVMMRATVAKHLAMAEMLLSQITP